MNNKVISTQIRLPEDIHSYIKQESAKLGITQNSFLVMLLAQGRKLWEADVTHLLEVK